VTSYRLFPSTDGPAAVTAYTGEYLAGLAFQVTAWNTWLEGFWWWVAQDGDTGAQSFALWQLYTAASSQTSSGLIPAATAESGPLLAGQWNYIPLSAPLALSAGVPYVAATGWTLQQGFPITTGQFGAGQPYASGITSGPLSAYSDVSGAIPTPGTMISGVLYPWAAQGLFTSGGGSDPVKFMPSDGYESSNFWMDVQVTDVPPATGTRRLWPALPVPPGTFSDSAIPYTLATAITLAGDVQVNRIWFCSPAGATILPAEAGIFSSGTQQLVTGSHQTGPAWSGPPGSGWVSADMGGLALPAGSYRVAVCSGDTSTSWNYATLGYFTTGAGSSGIGAGVISAPGQAMVAAAGGPGQGSYNQGTSLAWPGSYYSGQGGGPCYWVDLEVTHAPPLPPEGGVLLTFFP
jgi:hypothetical protein